MPRTATVRDSSWENVLSNRCNDIRELQGLLGLDDDETARLASVQETFPMFVNPYYLSLIRADDPDDPIRRMCIPSTEELDLAGLADTSGETSSTVLPGLQHKYSETALVLSTSRCAVYCRHCFRRRLVGRSDEETVRDIDAVAAYVDAHSEITNVLISGGDALMNNRKVLCRYLESFAEIGHVRTVRLGTRIPAVFPQRITHDGELLGILERFGKHKQLHVVTQFDHPAEVTPESRDSVRALLRIGVPTRNQTVLLKRVNDDPEVLARLMDDLVGIGVAPYYVFQCRPTVGVKNRFQVPLHEGWKIVERARTRLNGLAKSFRFIMSHDAGKIEILGPLDSAATTDGSEPGLQPVMFRFHQARDRRMLGKLFCMDVADDACWLEGAQIRSALDAGKRRARLPDEAGASSGID